MAHRCTSLTSLNASGTGGDLRFPFVHRHGDRMGAALRGLKGLTKLDLARCKAKGGGGFMLALEELPKIQTLSLSYALREATSSDGGPA